MRLSSLAFVLCCSLVTVFAPGCDLGDDEADSRFLEVSDPGAQECDCADPVCKDKGLCGDGEPGDPDPCSDPKTKENTPGCGDPSPTGECKLDGDGKPDCSDPACIDLCKE